MLLVADMLRCLGVRMLLVTEIAVLAKTLPAASSPWPPLISGTVFSMIDLSPIHRSWCGGAVIFSPKLHWNYGE
jgi:hypothetical protein